MVHIGIMVQMSGGKMASQLFSAETLFLLPNCKSDEKLAMWNCYSIPHNPKSLVSYFKTLKGPCGGLRIFPIEILLTELNKPIRITIVRRNPVIFSCHFQ